MGTRRWAGGFDGTADEGHGWEPDPMSALNDGLEPDEPFGNVLTGAGGAEEDSG